MGLRPMTHFEDLPTPARTLLIATLELEMAQAKCANILELANKRHLAIAELFARWATAGV